MVSPTNNLTFLRVDLRQQCCDGEWTLGVAGGTHVGTSSVGVMPLKLAKMKGKLVSGF